MVCPISQPPDVSLRGQENQNSGIAQFLLHAAGLRSYSPELGRWVNRDPIGEDGGKNLYRSFLNNTVCYFDPNGESVKIGLVITIGAFIYCVNCDLYYNPDGPPEWDKEATPDNMSGNPMCRCRVSYTQKCKGEVHCPFGLTLPWGSKMEKGALLGEIYANIAGLGVTCENYCETTGYNQIFGSAGINPSIPPTTGPDCND